jgi:hypothetical protein
MSRTHTHKHGRDKPKPLKPSLRVVQRQIRDQRALSAGLQQRYDARQDVPTPEPDGRYKP